MPRSKIQSREEVQTDLDSLFSELQTEIKRARGRGQGLREVLRKYLGDEFLAK